MPNVSTAHTGRQDLAHETPRGGMSGMRSADERNPSANHRTTAYTAEQQETLRRGLRILARIIARAHLRRHASQSAVAPRPSAEDEG